MPEQPAKPSIVAVGCDHAGFVLRHAIIELARELGFQVEEHPSFDGETCDYPEIAIEVGEAVAADANKCGILICGTGLGMCMAVNKVPGIRAAACPEPFSAWLARDHNDTNILCLGARLIGEELAREIARVWLTTPFSAAERHVRRIGIISAYERREPG